MTKLLHLSEVNKEKIKKILELIQSEAELQEMSSAYDKKKTIVYISPKKVKEKLGGTKDFRYLIEILNQKIENKSLRLELLDDKEILDRIYQTDNYIDPNTGLDLKTIQNNFIFHIPNLGKIKDLIDVVDNKGLVSEINQKSVTPPPDDFYTFYLSDHEIYRYVNGSKKEYLALENESIRYKLLKEFSTAKSGSIFKTIDLAEAISSDKKTVGKEIGNMRRDFSNPNNFAGLKRDDIFPKSRKGGGYKTNTRIRIICV